MRLVLILVTSIWLAGCATRGPEPLAALDEERRRVLYAFDDWQVLGRVAVRAGEESWHASLDWRHRPDVEVLRLSGPLGQGGVDVQVSDGFIRITHSDGTSEVSSRPQELLSDRIGFPVPLGALRYWVVGAPAPDSPSVVKHDDRGWLRTIRQMGWVVEYERYIEVGSIVLPQKLAVRRGEVMLKLIVDQWVDRVQRG